MVTATVATNKTPTNGTNGTTVGKTPAQPVSKPTFTPPKCNASAPTKNSVLTAEQEQALTKIVSKILQPGKGILAADDTNDAMGTRLGSCGMQNTEENRRRYRQLLFTTPNVSKSISAVILYDDTYHQATEKGERFVDLLHRQQIVPGIQVDLGLVPLTGSLHDEVTTQGMDNLAARVREYKKGGCEFAKFLVLYHVSDATPSHLALQENANLSARYASICQKEGLVPFIEPSVSCDGAHSLEKCQQVTEAVLSYTYKAMAEHNVFLEGTILKTNMVTPGLKSNHSATPDEIALATITALRRTVPPAVPGIGFLSGGIDDIPATQYLQAINALQDPNLPEEKYKPWRLTFCYGRALQGQVMQTWAGCGENVHAAQNIFLLRITAMNDIDLSLKQKLEEMNLNQKSPNQSVDEQLLLMRTALSEGDEITYNRLVAENGFDANLTRISSNGFESESNEDGDEFANELAALEEGELIIDENVRDEEFSVKLEHISTPTHEYDQWQDEVEFIGTVYAVNVAAPIVVTSTETYAAASTTVITAPPTPPVITTSATIEPATNMISAAMDNINGVSITAAEAELTVSNVQETTLSSNQSQMHNSESWVSNDIENDSMQLTLASAVYCSTFDASAAQSSRFDESAAQINSASNSMSYDPNDEDQIILGVDEFELDYDEDIDSSPSTSAEAMDTNVQAPRRSMFGSDLPPASALPASIGVVDANARRHLKIPRGDANDDDDDIIFLDAFAPINPRQNQPEIVQIDDDEEQNNNDNMPPNGAFIPVLQSSGYQRNRRKPLLSSNGLQRVFSTIVPNDDMYRNRRARSMSRHPPVLPPELGPNGIHINGDFLMNNLARPSTSGAHSPTYYRSNSRYSQHHTPYRPREFSQNRRFSTLHNNGWQFNSSNDRRYQRSQSCAPPTSEVRPRARSVAPPSAFERNVYPAYDGFSDPPIYQRMTRAQRRDNSNSRFKQQRGGYDTDVSHRSYNQNSGYNSAYNSSHEYDGQRGHHTPYRYHRSRSRHIEHERSRSRVINQLRHSRQYDSRKTYHRSAGMSNVQRTMALVRERKRKIESEYETEHHSSTSFHSGNHYEPPTRRARPHEAEEWSQMPGPSRGRSRPPQDPYHHNRYSSNDYSDHRRAPSRGRHHSRSQRTPDSSSVTYSASSRSSSSSSAYSSGGSGRTCSSRIESAAMLATAVDVALEAIKRQKKRQKKREHHKKHNSSRSHRRDIAHSDELNDDKVTFSKKELKSFIEQIINSKNNGATNQSLPDKYQEHNF